MEREAKKRKMEYTDDQEEKEKEDDEEEEMEKFFALLRSTKQMHDQLRRNSNSNRIFKEKEEIKKVGEARVSVAWNPSFLPEDFLEEDGRDSPAAAAAGGPSKRKEEEKKEEGEEGTGLDLKLSL
ncbi:hypothetical protein OIU76_003216 [Salix suchowensis]|nr:hypothetical protein OIU76_003216 [Salix suchowensis]